MSEDEHADARDRKRDKERRFVGDNRRSVRWLGRKLNRPMRGGVREWEKTLDGEKTLDREEM